MSYEIGPRLRKCREARGLSQIQLATYIGVSNSRISNWELGINRPDADVLVKICEALKISADEILDIRLIPEDMNYKEREMIKAYRANPELQRAVDILLGVDETP